MEDKGEEITHDEDPSVPFCSYPGVVAADSQDEVLECEIDAGGEERGSDDETADLDIEAYVVPGVVV